MGPLVTVRASVLDTGGAEYAARRAAMLAKLEELDAEHAKALAGGGPKYLKRHRDRGKLPVRERIELLIDPDSPFLELSALAGHGTGFPVGGSGVRGRGMSAYVVMIEGGSKVFLAGPPLVKMATGEESDDESLGGASMHSRQSGLADFLAETERDALRIGRSIVARLNWRKPGSGPALAPAEPAYDPDELLGIVPEDLKIPFDPREVITRSVDGSEVDGFKPQ